MIRKTIQFGALDGHYDWSKSWYLNKFLFAVAHTFLKIWINSVDWFKLIRARIGFPPKFYQNHPRLANVDQARLIKMPLVSARNRQTGLYSGAYIISPCYDNFSQRNVRRLCLRASTRHRFTSSPPNRYTFPFNMCSALDSGSPGPKKLRILSWNIDMDSEPINPRIVALIRTIRHEAPDVICLQELTTVSHQRIIQTLCKPCEVESKDSFKGDCSKGVSENPSSASESTPPQVRYVMHCPPEWSENLPYFCGMLTRHDLFRDSPTSDAERFITSKMFRGYLQVCGTLISKQDVSLITTHLESLPQSSQERKQQLAEILEIQQDCVANGQITIIAGDTNLRENEVPARLIEKTLPAGKGSIKGTEPKRKRTRIQPKFQDAWVLNGMDSQTKFTWDMAVNDNLDGFNDFKPKARYDRAFILCPSGVTPRVPEFRLLGKTRLDCEKFISDHWGILFSMEF